MIHDMALVDFISGSNFNYGNIFLYQSLIQPYVNDGRKEHVVEGENWSGFR